MPVESYHIIREQVIELTLPAAGPSRALQQQLSQCVQQEVIPALDQLFSELVPADRHVHIDQLEVVLDALPPDKLAREFSRQCLQAIRKALSEKLQQATARPSSAAKWQPTDTRPAEIFFYFLERGTLPWWAPPDSSTQLEARVQQAFASASAGLIDRLRKLLQQRPDRLQRLIWQFHDPLLLTLLRQLQPASAERLTALQQQLLALIPAPGDQNGSRQKQRELLWSVLFRHCLPTTGQTEKLTAMLTRAITHLQSAQSPAIELHTLLEQPVPEQSEDPDEPHSETGYYIDNAGLVILAPFFPALFTSVHLLQDGRFIDRTANERAVHLTQYLVDGQRSPPEHALLLNKLLCGWPLNRPLAREIQLSEHERREAEDLLLSAIQHWTVLGNTSMTGLRETFLKRKGILDFQTGSKSWLLQAEKKGVDILLDKLPWSYTVIRLPWMPDMLQVA